MASDTLPTSKAREKVVLKPGYHLSDWLRLMKASDTDMSGRKGGPPLQVTKEELAMHNKNYDCWTSYNGKVYNISNYIHFHPGGESKLMLGAGKDCTALFNKYHAWVNIDSMLSKCFVGKLVESLPITIEEKVEKEVESEKETPGEMDEMANRLAAQKLLHDDSAEIDNLRLSDEKDPKA